MRQPVRVAPGDAQHERLPTPGLYWIRASHALPTIQSRKTLKSVWLSPTALQRFNKFAHRYGFALTVSYMVFGTLAATGAFFPLPFGPWIALLSTPLALVSLTTTFLSLRYDMVVLLLGTFEFWYCGLVGLVGASLFALYTRDGRAASSISVIAIILMGLLFDANYRAMRHYIIMSFAAGVGSFSYAVFVTFAWAQDVHKMTIFRVYNRDVTAESVMTHSFIAAGIVELHNAYIRRSFAALAKRNASMTTVRCGVYRCRLRWHTMSSNVRQGLLHRQSNRIFSEDTVQLHCNGIQQAINARCTMFKRFHALSFDPWHWLIRSQLFIGAAVGFGGMIATFTLIGTGHKSSSPFVHGLGIASFAATTHVNAFFACFVYQVDVMRLLHTNFDFVFNFGQLLLAHVCICDLSNWDARAFATTSSLMWLHWAVVIDAIPPIKRTQLGINVRRLAAVIEITFLIGLIGCAFDLLDWHTQNFENRQIIPRFRNPNWSVGSFFLNRIASLTAWFCRSLYRLATYDTDELIALRGNVEFEDYEVHRRQRRRTLSSKPKINQIMMALAQQSHHVASLVANPE